MWGATAEGGSLQNNSGVMPLLVLMISLLAEGGKKKEKQQFSAVGVTHSSHVMHIRALVFLCRCKNMLH